MRFLLVAVCAVLLAGGFLGARAVRMSAENAETAKGAVSHFYAHASNVGRNVVEIALGPFRGLLISALCWQINQQQLKGNVYDVAVLGDAWCTLQPSNGKVWGFQANNLAYNIAFTFPTDESQYPWIMAGIKLLIDKGLYYAPESEQLKRELATLLLGKFSLAEDPRVAYNRAKYAETMCRYFQKGDRAEIESMITVDTTPEFFRQDPRVSEYLAAADRAGRNLLALYVWNDSETFPALMQAGLIGARADTPLDLIGRYHRVQNLKQDWKFSLQRMAWIDSVYGPFDWRMPYASVIYWDAQGDYDWLLKQSYARGTTIRTAIQLAFQEGRILDDSRHGHLLTLPNFEVLRPYLRYFQALVKTLPPEAIYEQYVRFLRTAIPTLYFSDEVDFARELHTIYLTIEPKAEKNFDLFLESALMEMLGDDSARNAKNLVNVALIQSAMMREKGYPRQAAAYRRFAHMVWTRNNNAYAAYEANKVLPPFEAMEKAAQHRLFHILHPNNTHDCNECQPEEDVDVEYKSDEK